MKLSKRQTANILEAHGQWRARTNAAQQQAACILPGLSMLHRAQEWTTKVGLPVLMYLHAGLNSSDGQEGSIRLQVLASGR